MAESKKSGLAVVPPIKHCWLVWAETWEGTKEQLQNAGIGVGLAFPGENGGPKRLLHAKSPDGLPAEISFADRYRPVADQYRAVSPHLQRPKEQPDYRPYAGGVMVRAHYWGADTYVGTKEALAAAGLARIDEFPGGPGRGKVRCTYHADGSCATNSPHGGSKPGRRVIQRYGPHKFLIELRISEDEEARRRADHERRESAEALEDEAAMGARMRARGLNPRDFARHHVFHTFLTPNHAPCPTPRVLHSSNDVDIVDGDGSFRRALSNLPRDQRHAAMRAIFQKNPKMGEVFYRGFRLLVAEIDDEEFDRSPTASAVQLCAAALDKARGH